MAAAASTRMALQPPSNAETPSASAFSLPQFRLSRRGSLASLSSVNHFDKETLSQALDEIHNVASQSDTFTAFNEYTSPPPSSSGQDGKGLASELQGGFSGLYNRLRASVGSARDITTPVEGETAPERLLSKDSNIVKPRSQYAECLTPRSRLSVDAENSTGSENVQLVSSGRSPVTIKTSNLEDSKIDLNGKDSRLGTDLAPQNISGSSLPAKVQQLGHAKSDHLKSDKSSRVRRELNEGYDQSSESEHDSLLYDPQTKSEELDGPVTPGRKHGLQHRGQSHSGLGTGISNHVAGRRGQEQLPAKHEDVKLFSRENEVSQDSLIEQAKHGGAEIPQGIAGPSINAQVNSVGQPYQESKSIDRTMADTSKVPSERIGQSEALSSQASPVPQPDPPVEPDMAQSLGFPSSESIAPPFISKARLPGFSRMSSTDTNSDSLSAAQLTGLRATPLNLITKSRLTSQLVPKAYGDQDGPKVKKIFSQAGNKVLSKEYWMKDENARDCFHCGESFSTFRRKHHCRICGQIFDSKCTFILNGEPFGHSGSIRVCLPCGEVINDNDNSSEMSEGESSSVSPLRFRHGSTGAYDASITSAMQMSPTATNISRKSPNHPDFIVPPMSIPATRKGGEKGKKPTVLEISTSHGLSRPSSIRSLKSASTPRPRGLGHRRHNSRHLHRSFQPVREDEAPFHQEIAPDAVNKSRLPAFHDDNIIDPDLAPYLSDQESSGDEQMSIMAALNGDQLSQSHDAERSGFQGFTSAAKKSRSRPGDKAPSTIAFVGKDGDSHSLQNSKMGIASRPVKRRNMSLSTSSFLRPSSRNQHGHLVSHGSAANLYDSCSRSSRAQLAPHVIPTGNSRMIRSCSMRGDAAPVVELNSASLRHVHRLLRQLLEDSQVPNVGAWEKALLPILLRATDDVNPDVQNGDDIDIRHYIKLKKVPGGRPRDTSYVSGLVFTQNLALKSMPRSIAHPNILILTFPLEYARHQQHFMSLEPVIRQEREFLSNLINRIAALRPQLLLVERNVSGLALEFLEQAGIATAYNVKTSVLEAVSRCCQTKIISSIDKLTIKPAQAGKCASFALRTYLHSGHKKTYMFLSGCAKELGCTIVLRGDDEIMLSKMKQITEFMTYVVYNLKLETSLMRDEYAAIPLIGQSGTFSLKNEPSMSAEAQLNEAISDMEQTKCGLRGRATDAVHEDAALVDDLSKEERKNSDATRGKLAPCMPEEDSVPDDVPMPTFYGDMVEEHKTKILSASPFVKFMQPYLLMRAREQERRLAYLKRLRDQDSYDESKGDEKAKAEKFDLITPEMIHETVPNASRKVREVLHAVHDAEYDKALHIYQTQTKQWEAYIASSIDLFDPYAHQNIAVLYSVVCTATTIPCSGPDLLALGFYNEHDTEADFEADCTLGQYVEDLCLGANAICTSNGCERQMLEHHRQYVHGEAQLTVFVERFPCKVKDMQDTILMWNVCKKCGKETQVQAMSENTWKYSFGKYLELSFWCSDLRPRGDHCLHDLHRDHVRYFGFKDMALRVHYDPVVLVEIIVPRARITWKVDNDLRFKNDLFGRIEERVNRFMISVRARIKSINTQSVLPEKTKACEEEIEALTKKVTEEHHALVQRLRKRYMNSKHFEIVPLNRVIRATQEKVAEWDTAFADFDRKYLPSEKDIRRLATLQLKSIFLEREKAPSGTDTSNTTSSSLELSNEKTDEDASQVLVPQTRDMSPDKAHDMLASVVEKHVTTTGEIIQDQETIPHLTPQVMDTACSARNETKSERVQNLDLAVPSQLSERPQHEHNGAWGQPDTTDIVERKDKNSEQSLASPLLSREMQVSTGQVDSSSATNRESCTLTPAVDRMQASAIPRPIDLHHRNTRSDGLQHSLRVQSQPGHTRSNNSSTDSGHVSPFLQPPFPNQESTSEKTTKAIIPAKPVDKKLADRLGLNALKQGSAVAQSMIPRSITKRKDSKVSSLAKHFEQLSREFERERIRERRQQATQARQSRAYPMAASKPIVQVYKNVHEAVEEKEPPEEEPLSSDPSYVDQEDHLKTSQAMAESQLSETSGLGFHTEHSVATSNTSDDKVREEQRSRYDEENEASESDEDYTIFDDLKIPDTADEHHVLTPEEAQMDLKLDLPKHEKSSLMKMLSNFWAERSASGWKPLDYPLNATDHIFADSDIIVREDEPSSLIALSLNSEDYQQKLSRISDKLNANADRDEDGSQEDSDTSPDNQLNVEQSLLRPTGTHLKYQFSESSARMLCKVFYAEQFDAVRRKCGVSERFTESLSRCLKWDSKGGKTKSVFLKTLDDRFVLKSLSQIETQAFLRFAPAYFRIMSESLFHELPSVIAKMLGFYQVIIKNPVTGVEFNWFLLVMENLFYDRSPTRIFDLKGSMRNRRIQSTGEQNEVLLDENMVEFIYESPLFSREHSKKLLRASVWNDTLFLSRQNVMDYSLMIAIDENKRELVVGIIDCIRTYTWDKKLESWIKDRGKNRPTVTSPKEYKSRFREAMGRYVLQAPDCWHQFKAQQVEARPLRMEDPGDDQEVKVVGL